jgi:hypothetical protein
VLQRDSAWETDFHESEDAGPAIGKATWPYSRLIVEVSRKRSLSDFSIARLRTFADVVVGPVQNPSENSPG